MKYIKLFESHSNQNELEDDIKGIFAESIDNSFRIRFFYKDYFSIEIEHDVTDWFNLADIYENIIMLIDYMKYKSPNLKFSFSGEMYNTSSSDEFVRRTDLDKYKETYFSYIELNFQE